MMKTNSMIVRDFIACWATKNAAVLIDYFTDDAVYTNIPLDPPSQTGKKDIRDFIAMSVAPVAAIEFVIHFQAEDENGVVMNERTDRFYLHGEWIALPVMGIFELRDGKICKWRDYFDMNAAAPLLAALANA